MFLKNKISKTIFLVGPNVNYFSIKVLSFFLRPSSILLDSFFPQRNKKHKLKKYFWNENDPVLKYKITSIAFEIMSKKNFNSSNFLENIFLTKKGISNGISLDIKKKIFLEKITYILLLIGLSNKVKEDKIFLILPIAYKKIFKEVLIFLSEDNNKLLSYPMNIKTIYLGFKIIDYLKNYFISLGIVIYFISTIRFLKKSITKKSFKVGLLSWNSSREIDGIKKENFGLDAVLPDTISLDDVVVYSKNALSRKFVNSVVKNKFNLINFKNNLIFKYCSFSDLKNLIYTFFSINFEFLKGDLKKDFYLIDSIPKIIYNIIKWRKFIQIYNLDISLSYNDYAISDLIRNKIFLQKNIQCWGYVHSTSDIYLYSKKKFLLDCFKSFISYSRRYYLMPEQNLHFELSGIVSGKNILIGPLFQNYKKFYRLDKVFKNKIVVSVFSSSVGDNAFNPISSHISFFDSLFKLLSELDQNYLFLIKVKNLDLNFSNLNKSFNSKLFKNLEKENKILLIDDSVKSQELINISNGVVSMAFTSPTFEALSSKIPAIFYDPCHIAKGNYIENIQGLYITEETKAKIFIKNLEANKQLNKWVSKVRKKIGLENANLGIEKIKNDLAVFLKNN